MRTTIMFGAMALALASLSASAWGANLVTNPGFETDTVLPASPPAGWSVGAVTDPASDLPTTDAGADNAFAHTGNNDAYIGDATLTQIVATTLGTNYLISFWVAVDDSTTYLDPLASFDARFGSIDLLNGTPIVPTDLSLSHYHEYTATVTATADFTPLVFEGVTSNDDGSWYLDDVAVSTAQVPEPAGTASMLVGLAGITWSRRRRT